MQQPTTNKSGVQIKVRSGRTLPTRGKRIPAKDYNRSLPNSIPWPWQKQTN